MFKTWVVVAGAERARIFAMKDARVPLLELADIDNVFDGTTPERTNGDRFADQIATRVEAAGADDVFDDLILVGEPEVIGRIRDRVSDRTRRRLRRVLTEPIVTANETQLRRSLRARS